MDNIEWIIFSIAALCVLAGIFIKGCLEEHKKHKQFLSDLKENYGKRPEREYEYNEFQSITHYYKRSLENYQGSVIDDITWHDLDMDSIYMLVNHTWSQSGQEYLYDILRKPIEDTAVLEERDRVIRYFMENEPERIRLQDAFAGMGRTSKLSMSDYIHNLRDVEMKSSLPHYLCCALGLFAMVMIFVNPPIGFGLFILSLIVNLFVYFRRKGQIDPYITTFGYLMRMMREAKKITGLNIPEIRKYDDELNDAIRQMRGFQKHSYILMSGQRMTGNIMELPLDYLRMFFHLDLIKFNSMLKMTREHEAELQTILRITGFLDSMIAIGEFRASLAYYCVPEFEQAGDTSLSIRDLYHPLLEKPVSSTIQAEHGVLITGSNASGKSTFLKSVAICAVLAETIDTAIAREYKSSFFAIYSSMALNDDIFSGESYYIVEIKSLKRILDASKNPTPILCFIDEVLRGTNTVERIAASSQILKSLQKKHIICFAATHDIELTHILETSYDNYHFTENVQKNDIVFSYELQSGRATSRNAIKLLNIIGYDESITKQAEFESKKFLENGVWEKL